MGMSVNMLVDKLAEGGCGGGKSWVQFGKIFGSSGQGVTVVKNGFSVGVGWVSDGQGGGRRRVWGGVQVYRVVGRKGFHKAWVLRGPGGQG